MKSKNRIRRNRSAARPALQVKNRPQTKQIANPLPTAQQRMDLMTLKGSIEAATSLLATLAENDDRGLQNVADIVIAKLNSDFNAMTAFKLSPSESVIVSGGAR
jgi:hypothetical protein